MKFVQIDKTGLNLPRMIPRCLVLNARSLVVNPMPSPLVCGSDNDIDICCISETWLKPIIPDNRVCPDGFSIIRKDRTNYRGGGVATISRNDWKMQIMRNSDNLFECLWTKIDTQIYSNVLIIMRMT